MYNQNSQNQTVEKDRNKSLLLKSTEIQLRIYLGLVVSIILNEMLEYIFTESNLKNSTDINVMTFSLFTVIRTLRRITGYINYKQDFTM